MTIRDTTVRGKSFLRRLVTMLLIFIVAAAGTVLYVIRDNFYDKYVEKSAPVIEIVEMPRGVALTPTTLKVRLIDNDSGLDEVVVRTRQKGNVKEVLRQSLGGETEREISVTFQGEKSGLEEGTAYIEIKAFDRSFWSNSSQQNFAINIDYHKPRLEILTTQHNARHGGSQLVFYKAEDSNLAASGVKVGSRTFLGYPAAGLDSEFTDPSVYAVVYAVDLRQQVSEEGVRLFAEDRAGNQTTLGFYNKISPRGPRAVNVKVSAAVLEQNISALVDLNQKAIEQRLKKAGGALQYQNPVGTKEYFLEKFQLANAQLRPLSEIWLLSQLKDLRFESYWTKPFKMPSGSIQGVYGDKYRFSFEGRELGDALQLGYEILPVGTNYEVNAAAAGVVTFVGDLGTYGNSIIIDHGLGLVSVYAHLRQGGVARGATVAQGQPIGFMGDSGFSRSTNVYFAMLVQGVPVDPVEWTDSNWFAGHITGKILDMKKALGIAVYKPVTEEVGE